MKKTIYLKSVLLLCLLLVGAVSTQAQDYDYEWVKVTDLSTVTENDVVLLVDVTLPVGDGGTSGTPDSNDDVSEFEDLLAKPGIIYDAWEDDDKEIDFHTYD